MCLPRRRRYAWHLLLGYRLSRQPLDKSVLWRVKRYEHRKQEHRIERYSCRSDRLENDEQILTNARIPTILSTQHKNLLKHAKGYRGKSKNCFSIAIRRVHKAWQYAYRDRKVKKRRWRSLWILRLNAAVRQYQWNYSTFMASLGHNRIGLNRKVLSELAANEPFAFKSVVDVLEQQPLQQPKLWEETKHCRCSARTEQTNTRMEHKHI